MITWIEFERHQPALLMLTQADRLFPAGSTIWEAEGIAMPESTARPDIVI